MFDVCRVCRDDAVNFAGAVKDGRARGAVFKDFGAPVEEAVAVSQVSGQGSDDRVMFKADSRSFV